MKKKFILSIFLLLILITNFSFATISPVTMSVVKEPICSIDLTDKSKFEKKLYSKDLDNKEVTLQLQLTNGEEKAKPTGEIMLVLDNSLSMEEKVNDVDSTTRKKVLYDATETLIKNLLTDNSSLKIGVVSFSTTPEAENYGTTEDAQLISKLTSDVSSLKNSVLTIETQGQRTDLQAGINLANKQFSTEENNKYMIILTDGIPNVSANNTSSIDTVITDTKNALDSTSKSGINVTTLLTGISNPDNIETPFTESFTTMINTIWGTTENPNYGTFYYIKDDEIEKTIITNIYNDLIPIEKSLKDITIVDYFPKEIVENFEFAYITKANIGNISTKIDTETNSITWIIPELKSGETATVQYTLKLKEDFDNAIIDKILDTNEKVDINYTDVDNLKQTKSSDITPQLKLKDNTLSDHDHEPAGLSSNLIFIILGIIITVIFFISYISLKNKMK